MTHIANRTHATNAFTRSTLTVYPVGTWRNERTAREVTQALYFYQCGSDRYTITVWHKKAKPLSIDTSM